MPTTIGESTRAIFYKKEAQKLHEAFQVADGETVYEGMPVKLNDDGEILPAAANDTLEIIGYAINENKDVNEPVSVNKELSVVMRGQCTILAEASADLTVAGPVKFVAFNSTTGRGEYSSATVTIDNMVGWALTGGDDGDEIKVVLK